MNTVKPMEDKKFAEENDFEDTEQEVECDLFNDALIRSDEKEYKRKQIEKKSRMFK